MNYSIIYEMIKKGNQELLSDIKDIKNQKTNDGITVLSASPKCICISSSVLFSEGIWDPKFYDVEAQRDELLSVLGEDLCRNINKITKVIINKKLPSGTRCSRNFIDHLVNICHKHNITVGTYYDNTKSS